MCHPAGVNFWEVAVTLASVLRSAARASVWLGFRFFSGLAQDSWLKSDESRGHTVVGASNQASICQTSLSTWIKQEHGTQKRVAAPLLAAVLFFFQS